MFQTKEEFFIKNILTIFFIFLGLILLCIFIFLCRSLLSMNSTILKSLSEVGKSLGNLKSCVGHLTKRGEGKRKGNFCVPNGAEPAGGQPLTYPIYSPISLYTPPPPALTLLQQVQRQMDGWIQLHSVMPVSHRPETSSSLKKFCDFFSQFLSKIKQKLLIMFQISKNVTIFEIK